MAESMAGLKRSCRCTEVTEANVGQELTLMGWVQKSRNKGGIIFTDLRDRTGIIQIIFEEIDCGAESFAKAERLRSEFTIAVTGVAEKRSGAANENLKTGSIEVRAKSLRILSESEVPPFPIEENSKTREEVRLKYRYLDLRRPDLQRNILVRSRVATMVRQFLADEGFLEIETPTLIKSTPEGARDYLVPSRVHPGNFYALPQSPQLLKQLLMCSGFDRYFQLARCYRDEDLRADRQPEFTQIDMELSFVEDYCSLQKLRFSDRLNYVVDRQVPAEGIMIPKLLLQPIVENSILHGVEPCNRACTIRISLSPAAHGVTIVVEDDGAGCELPEGEAPGIGLANVRERLASFSPQSSFSMESRPGEGTRTVIELYVDAMEETIS